MGPDPCVVNEAETVRCERAGRSRGTYICVRTVGREPALQALSKVLDFSLETAKSQGC